MRTSFCRYPSGATRKRWRSGATSKPIAQRKPPAAAMFSTTTGCAWLMCCAITACRSALRRPPTAGRPTDEPDLRFVVLVVLLIFLDVLILLGCLRVVFVDHD